MPKPNPERVICASLPPQTVAEIRSLAREKGTTPSAIARDLIQDGLTAIGRPVSQYVPYGRAKKRAPLPLAEVRAAQNERSPGVVRAERSNCQSSLRRLASSAMPKGSRKRPSTSASSYRNSRRKATPKAARAKIFDSFRSLPGERGGASG